MSITTTYRGHNIYYNDNTDEWVCSDLGHGFATANLHSAEKLSTVKSRIDKMYLTLRSKEALRAFELPGVNYAAQGVTEATVSEFVRVKEERDFRGKITHINHIVASIAKRQGSNKAARTTKTIADIMPDTPEAHAAFAEFVAFDEVARAAQKAASAKYYQIPRLTVADIQPLIDLKYKMDDMGANDDK